MNPMTTTSTIETLADLLSDLGEIPPSRVQFRPAPGTATEADLLAVRDQHDRICELIDGVLVEKATGFREALLAVAIGQFLREFVTPQNLGLVSGPDGVMRLFPGLVRIPDVAFVAWDRIPGGKVPTDPIPDLIPNLAIEVYSPSNTKKEMDRKFREFFSAGVELVWLVEPDPRTVTIFTAVDQSQILSESDTLDGGAVLPGFTLPLAELFAELDRQAP